MVQPFYEDMGRKAQWFYEIHGTNDFTALDKLRDNAVAHVEVMREARRTRLDPGGGAIDKPSVLTGAERRATTAKVDLPGHVDEGFITVPIQVSSSEEELGATRKEAILDVAHRSGVPKRVVYDAVHRP